MNLNTKRQAVLGVIQRNPDAANDDMLLYERYWIEVDGWTPGRSMRKCTRPETISRRRRELFNMGLITYTDEADKEREEAYVKERQYAAIPWLADECGA